jgi:hypothetical protein
VPMTKLADLLDTDTTINTDIGTDMDTISSSTKKLVLQSSLALNKWSTNLQYQLIRLAERQYIFRNGGLARQC